MLYQLSYEVMVPETGLEPVRPLGQQILSLLCLPIPSLGHLAETLGIEPR